MSTRDPATAAGRLRRLVRQIGLPGLVLAVIAALCGLGIFGYFNERSARQVEYGTGDDTTPDRVDLDVTLQRVDPNARQLTVVVLGTMSGRLAEDGIPYVPSQDVTVDTSSLTNGTLLYKAGERVSAQDLTVGLDSGVVSDYPFDTYTTSLGFYATIGDRPVPVSLVFRNYDPTFLARPTGADHPLAGSVLIDLRISRSRGLYILAWFLMVTMWVLALSVFGAAWIIVSQRRGLVWPAMGWMAATLFALIAVRNSVPGAPPIGSLFDYAAFLWAEAIVAISLAVVAVHGMVVERARRAG
jgi:hypothetical protein